MIDVPIEVKDALRAGTYKKNYRFVVQSWHPVYNWADIYTHEYTDMYEVYSFTFSENGVYRFHAPSGSGRWYTQFMYNGEIIRNVQTYSDMYYEVLSGTTVTMTYSSTSLVIQKQYNTPEWGTDFTIDNDNLVSESVSIDERMCSGDTLMFGLCEGSSLEFQYFDKPNITGKRVQAFVDVQYRVGIMGRIDASGSFTTPVNGSYTFEVKKGSATGLYITYAGGGDMYVDFVLGQTTDTEELEVGDVVTLNNPSTDALFEVSTDMWVTIPMGFFDVKKCSRQASTGIIKATCYNKLQSDYLDAKANDQILAIGSDIGVTNMSTIKNIMDSLLNDYMIDVRMIDPDYGTITVGATQYTQSYMDINLKYIGESTVYHFWITTAGLRIDPIEHNMHCNIDSNKRIQITHLESYITQLEAMVAAFKDTIFHLYQNPEATWELFKQSGISALGCVVHFYGSNAPALYVTDDMIPNIVTGNYMIIDSISKLRYLSNVQRIDFNLIGHIMILNSQGSPTGNRLLVAGSNFHEEDYPVITITDNTDQIDNITVNVAELPDVTMREIVSADYELHCQFGQLSRFTDLFSGAELNHSRLYPADSLYPETDLYPSGAAVSGFKSMYSKLWADEGNIHKWRYLIITYKGLDGDGNETDYTLQRTVNTDGTDDYNMSDNWLFRNLVWTAEQIAEYAEAMVAKMQDVTWFPFEMWCAGLPYLETGDEIEIPLNGESYTSYVLQRQLKGIQNLQDTYINGTLDIF